MRQDDDEGSDEEGKKDKSFVARKMSALDEEQKGEFELRYTMSAPAIQYNAKPNQRQSQQQQPSNQY